VFFIWCVLNVISVLYNYICALTFSGFLASRRILNENSGREKFPFGFQDTEGTTLTYVLYILCSSKIH
jgi:hypothetical protein